MSELYRCRLCGEHWFDYWEVVKHMKDVHKVKTELKDLKHVKLWTVRRKFKALQKVLTAE